MNSQSKALFAMFLVATLSACGGPHGIKIKVIEQIPKDTPDWVDSGKGCNDCKDVSLAEGEICFVGRSTNQTSLDKARVAAAADATRKVVSYYVGDLVDSQVELIMDGENTSEEDRTTVDLAMTMVTLGETGGFVTERENYERTYYRTDNPGQVLYDAQFVMHVDANMYANKLADQLEEKASERRESVRQKLNKRADMLRQRRWDQMNAGQ